jgi:hypothetical protein
MCFDPYEAKNVLRVAELGFEDTVVVMEEQGISRPKDLSEFEFYSKLRFYEKKFKETAR